MNVAKNLATAAALSISGVLASAAGPSVAVQTPPPAPPAPTAAAPATPGNGGTPSGVPTPDVRPATVEVTTLRGLPGRSVALLVSGQQGGQIAVSMLVFPPGSAGKPGRVPWVMDVPGPTLASVATSGVVGLELAVYAMRGGDKVVGSQLCALRVAGAPGGWRAGGGLKVLGFVDASSAPNTVRVLVREPASGAFGVWQFPVPSLPGRGGTHGDAGIIPIEGGGPQRAGADAGAGAPALGDAAGALSVRTPMLLAVVAPDPEDAWVVTGVGGPGIDAAAPPFSLVGKGSVPSTRPVFKAGTSVRLVLLGSQMPPNPTMTARLRRSDARSEVSLAARLLTRLPAPAGDFERLVVLVALPADLTPGEHEMTVGCRAGSDAFETSVATRFRVAPLDQAGPAPVWPGVPVGENGQTVALPVRAGGTPGSEDEPPPQLKGAYRDAVARVAADDSAASLRALVGLERAALGRGNISDLNRLANTSLALGREVRKVTPRALLGLCLVNLDLYREHSRDEASLAIAHSRRVVEQLAAMFAAETKDKDSTRAAADVLAVFAGELQDVGSWATSERVFARAVSIDSGNVAALMGRAGVFERAGQPGEAIKVLEKVLALNPDHREARLRLGVNQRRAGRAAAAVKSLTACTLAENPAWVRAVAWQELAAMLLADGKASEAVRVLRVAATEVPADQHLRVLLACTLDRERRHRDALTVLNATVERPAGITPSARFIYAEWPHEDLEAARLRLDAARPEALAALAAAGKEERP